MASFGAKSANFSPISLTKYAILFAYIRRIELTSLLYEAFIVMMKLSTAIHRFDAQLRADGRSPLTRSIYLRDLNAFRQWLGKNVNIASITPQLLTKFLTSKSFTHSVSGKKKAVITLNRSKSAFRSFFRFLAEAGYLKQNPARLIRLASSTRKPPTYLTEKEIQSLLSAIRRHKTPAAKRDHLMFSILIGTGIRLSSLVALNVGDVNLSQSVLRINGKGNVERIVFLNACLKKLLRNRIANRQADEPLVLSVRGSRIGYRQVQLRLDYWLEKAGLTRHFSVHSLRHSFACRLYEKTGDLRLVQRALGHKHITTTEIYTHVADAKLKRAVQSLGSLV